MLKDTFYYGTGWISFSAAGTQSVNINIGKDADFNCNYFTLTVRQSDVTVTNWGGDILIKDSAAGKDLMNVAIPGAALAGDGRQPYPLPGGSRAFMRNTTIIVTITHNCATATDLNFVLHGDKVISY